MPRARTQSGSASCADTDSEFAAISHAAPPIIIVGTATHRFGAKATIAMASACPCEP